jgi:hypothetical protein
MVVLRANSCCSAGGFITAGIDCLQNAYVEECLRTLDDDWQLFNKDKKAGLFCLAGKLGLFEKILSSGVSERYKFFVDESLIPRLSNTVFWNGINSAFSTAKSSEISRDYLSIACRILHVIASICLSFPDSCDSQRQLQVFLREFQRSFTWVLIGERNDCLSCITFVSSLLQVLSSLSEVEKLKEIGIWGLISYIFAWFSREDEWICCFNGVGKDKDKEIEEAKKQVESLRIHCLYLLNKMSEFDAVFDGPLSGLVWMNDGQKPPIFLVVSFIQKILRDDKERKEKEGVIGAGLMLIWRHLNKWESCPGDGTSKWLQKEEKLFGSEFFGDFRGDGYIDRVVMKKLS